MSGHGHVNPNPDGSKARCGGPAICSVCALELAQEQAKITAKIEPPAGAGSGGEAVKAGVIAAIRAKIAIALHDAECPDRHCNGPALGAYYRQADIALEAAAPAIAAQAAAAERARILVSDETLHADGSIGPDTAPPWGGDAAYWYRRWLFAVKQLDEEGSQRLSAYAGMREHLDEVAATAGAHVAAECIRLEERARIRQLATDHGAIYFSEPRPCSCKPGCAQISRQQAPFTDLIRDEP